MKVRDIDFVQIRFFCKKHKRALRICGSHDVFVPTSDHNLNNKMNKGGWLEFDLSEFCCPEGSNCQDYWEVQVR